MDRYRIVRTYRDTNRREIIKDNLSLENAQGHCRSKETSSSTCTHAEGRARTTTFGPWFDGYELAELKRIPRASSLTRALVGIYQLD